LANSAATTAVDVCGGKGGNGPGTRFSTREGALPQQVKLPSLFSRHARALPFSNSDRRSSAAIRSSGSLECLESRAHSPHMGWARQQASCSGSAFGKDSRSALRSPRPSSVPPCRTRRSAVYWQSSSIGRSQQKWRSVVRDRQPTGEEQSGSVGLARTHIVGRVLSSCPSCRRTSAASVTAGAELRRR
jgi:hypothetical protein